MSQCKCVGSDGTKVIPYRCGLEEGHAGDHDLRLDASVTDDQVKVRPSHYRLTLKNVTVGVGSDSTYMADVQVEAIDVIEALSEAAQDFYVSTALLYLLRLGLKDEPRVEVKKAVWYLERWLRRNP